MKRRRISRLTSQEKYRPIERRWRDGLELVALRGTLAISFFCFVMLRKELRTPLRGSRGRGSRPGRGRGAGRRRRRGISALRCVGEEIRAVKRLTARVGIAVYVLMSALPVKSSRIPLAR